MLSNKDVEVINICLKTMSAFGNDKSKTDIAETIKNFNREVRKSRKVKKDYEDFKRKHNIIR